MAAFPSECVVYIPHHRDALESACIPIQPTVGIEPTTVRLRSARSTAELYRQTSPISISSVPPQRRTDTGKRTGWFEMTSRRHRGCGVAVSHPLRMRRAPGSNPGSSSFVPTYALNALATARSSAPGSKQNGFRVRELNPGHLRDRQIY